MGAHHVPSCRAGGTAPRCWRRRFVCVQPGRAGGEAERWAVFHLGAWEQWAWTSTRREDGKRADGSEGLRGVEGRQRPREPATGQLFPRACSASHVPPLTLLLTRLNAVTLPGRRSKTTVKKLRTSHGVAGSRAITRDGRPAPGATEHPHPPPSVWSAAPTPGPAPRRAARPAERCARGRALTPS